MFQNKGFTLIETLLVLSIIVSLTLLNIPYYHHDYRLDDNLIKDRIGMIIEQAKQNSIIYHQQTNLIINSKEIYFMKENNKISFSLPDKCYFSDLKEIYFNEFGNINQANHVILNTTSKNYKLVFHLGAGEYEFQ